MGCPPTTRKGCGDPAEDTGVSIQHSYPSLAGKRQKGSLSVPPQPFHVAAPLKPQSGEGDLSGGEDRGEA